ncbi:MFS transporter [Acidovorax sp.]|uniref:MFS transporter n=1 Tax=Acidovorax sp. TaxID=1872122 RepID=UPI003BAEE773
MLSQWLGTSLWFSPSGAADGIAQWLGLAPSGFGWLLSATQLGFILGTLLFTLLGWADKFAPERLFATSCAIGAVLNCVWLLAEPSFAFAWACRFAVGVTLAGIYPMGMKMIVQRSGASAGWALGWLVGMLTLGTAMPQILRMVGASWPWQWIVWGATVLAIVGAVLVVGLAGDQARPDTGSSKKRSFVADLRELVGTRGYRAACAGYLGHMWELYAFWAVVPLLVRGVLPPTETATQVAAVSALVIAVGSVGCVVGGMVSRRIGSGAVARISLVMSGFMCTVYPFIPAPLLMAKLTVLALWGVFVVSDSPQFSALTASHVPARLVGTALTAQNCLGFLLTVISILLLQTALLSWGDMAVWLLVPGPVFGVWALNSLRHSNARVPT